METLTSMDLLRIALGAVVLLAGRNLFWIVVGLVGFLFGVEIAQAWLVGSADWVVAGVAVAFGLLGAILAILFERVAFALAGFYAAAFVASVLAAELGYAGVPTLWLLAAGVLGALVAALIMDWAIIVLSALAGAAAIVSATVLTPGASAVVFVVLAALGMSVQYAFLRRRRGS